MAADWSADVIEAVKRWRGGQYGSSALSPRWRRLGHAVPHRDGWLVLDLREGNVTADSLGQACFSDVGGPDQGMLFPLDQVRSVDGVVHLAHPPHLPASCRYVWAQSMSTRFLLDRLEQGLQSAGSAPLAEALAAGRLAGPPTDRTDAPGFLEAQREAFRAALSPGVRLVWGPPGTGKTQVLARAIEEHVHRGNRVLLVSSANIAVDNALHAVVSRLGGEPGTAIRVGLSHLAAIATDPNVQLELLSARASGTADRERDRVAQRLSELDQIETTIVQLEEELIGYDDVVFQEALGRIEAEESAVPIRAWVDGATAAAESAAADVRRSHAVLASAASACAALAGPRQAHQDLALVIQKLSRLDDEQRSRDLTRDTLEATAPSGWSGRRQRANARKAAMDAATFAAQAAGDRRKLLDLQLRARQAIGSITLNDLAAVDDQHLRAGDDVDRAEQSLAQAEAQLSDARRRLADLEAIGEPSADDRALVQDGRAGRLPDKYRDLRRLQERQRTSGDESSRLRRQHRELVDRARRMRADAEKELIREARVVATTLARSRVNQAVAVETFDVVLIDEAGASTLAEVLLALCRGRTTGVLFGDFLQLGPVLDRSVKDDRDERVTTWVRGTCFSHLGISTPRQAIEHRGCVALTHQFRFGPELRRVANDVAYDVLEDAPGSRAVTEIVLVDVSTVPELADVRAAEPSGRWWAAGIVLSRALAEIHLIDGDDEVAVVTPYNVESDAVLAGLRDQGVATGVAVGTVHSFQGREYGTVVFDLVDDGRGWIGKGRREGGSGEITGLRLFGVGITRARHRLYLIVDGRAVDVATDGPFAALRAAKANGDVRVWSAAALLGLDDPPVGPVDTSYGEVSELLQQLVTITDVHDERSFVAELHTQLESARRTVWMWSPWIANRAKEVVPLIGDAVARGVDVRVFLRPDHDKNIGQAYAQRPLADLTSTGATVIRSDLEHRKIVVIDGAVVLLGSLNPLSADPRRTREVMLTMRGVAFAERLLTDLRASEIGTPQPCATCSRTMEVRREGGKAANLFRQCRTCHTKIPMQRSASSSSSSSRARS